MADCMYCDPQDVRRLELMTPIAPLETSTLHFYREQTYPGRCVLVYHRHVHRLTELEPEECAALFRDVRKAADTLTRLYHPDKINYLILGDLCPHLHVHLVPKYQGGADWGTMFRMMPEPPAFSPPRRRPAKSKASAPPWRRRNRISLKRQVRSCGPDLTVFLLRSFSDQPFDTASEKRP